MWKESNLRLEMETRIDPAYSRFFMNNPFHGSFRRLMSGLPLYPSALGIPHQTPVQTAEVTDDSQSFSLDSIKFSDRDGDLGDVMQQAAASLLTQEERLDTD